MSPTRPALLALALLAAAPLSAQSQEELVQRRDDKLAEEWLTKGPWITRYEDALEQAKASGKPIFAYFSRSYSP